MLTHKRIVVASLAILIVLASLMLMSPVEAAPNEMPPYEICGGVSPSSPN